ncbi:MAG: outer membrane protein assembly factor BamB family protein [Planctomycetota bacterium]|jgi:outer membrane protein assembly factor BamB
MDCEEARGMLRAGALGPVEDRPAADLESHLAGCADCRRLREEYARAVGTVRNAGGVSPSDDALERAVSAGRAELARGGRLARVRLAAAALLAAAGLVGGIVWARALLAPRAAACGCWRFVAGDAGNSRRVSDTVGAFPREVIWEQPVRGTPGNYKPLAWKELVVVNTAPQRRTFRGGGGLTALDASSGEVRWTRNFGAGDFHKDKGFPDRCIAGGRLYVTDGTRCLVLDLATGEDRCALQAPEGSAGWGYLTEDEGRLYGASRDGRTLFAVDAASGRELWCRPAESGVFVPALSDGLLIAATRRGSVLALDVRDGQTVWVTGGLGPRGRASVHAASGRALVVGENGKVTALETRSGKGLWTRSVPGAFASGAAVGRESAYLLAGTLALCLDDGRTSWAHRRGEGKACSPPALAGRRVLAAAGEEFGSLEMISPGGRVVGKLSGAARRACDGPIVSDGTVFTVGGGRIRALARRPQG